MNPLFLGYLIIFSGSFWLDRWTKQLAIRLLSHEPLAVTSWLDFNLQWNRGISFSWFTFDSTFGYVAITALVIAVIAIFGLYTVGQYRTGNFLYGEMVVLSGALSNVIDRFKHGAVVDFIDFHIGSWHFATFNIADICICFGITWIMLMQIKEVYDARVKNNS